MKDSYYFQHDYNPTSDPKITCLLGNYGGFGYGVFWRIIEMLHQEETHKLPLKLYVFEALAKEMISSAEQIEKIINECIKKFELLQGDEKFFWSNRVFLNIQEREEKRIQKSEAGKMGMQKRWNNAKISENNVITEDNNVITEDSIVITENNTDITKITKERKGKEKKGNKPATPDGVACPSVSLSEVNLTGEGDDSLLVVGTVSGVVVSPQITKESKNKRKWNDHGIPSEEIDEIFHILSKVNPHQQYGNTTERECSAELIHLHSFDGTKKLAEYAVSIFGKPFKPVITTPFQLKSKYAQLHSSFLQENTSGSIVIGSEFK